MANQSTVSIVTQSEAYFGSNARTPGTSLSEHTHTHKHTFIYAKSHEAPVFLLVFPHPLQEARPHPVWCLQAALQILEEDPEWRIQEEVGFACKEVEARTTQ